MLVYPSELEFLRFSGTVFACNIKDGKVVCKPLTEHPKYNTWKDEMSAGEFWSMFGEKWVVE